MKKLLPVLFALMILLVSCGQKEVVQNENTGPSTPVLAFNTPEEITLESLNLSDEFLKEKMTARGYEHESAFKSDILGSTKLWKTGTFTAGAFEGQDLITASMPCDGPCQASIYRFARDDANKWTLLGAYSSDTNEFTIIVPVAATDMSEGIPELSAPKALKVWQGDGTVQAGWTISYDGNEIVVKDGEKIDLEDKSFGAYYTFGGCIYGLQSDGVLVRYTLAPNEFISDGKGNTNGAYVEGIKTVALTYSDGKVDEKEFSIESGGCGIAGTCVTAYEASSDDMAKLQKLGMFGDKEAWVLSDVDENSKGGLEGAMSQAYVSYKVRAQYDEGATIMSFEDFLAGNYAFFVKMGTGKYVMVRDGAFAPAAECGKPVVYLYPQKDTRVSVKVGIDKFTKTIPAYENGWKVLAHVGGTLTNLADGKNYPYLFWEGISNANVSALNSWTLKKSEVSTLLPKALAGMGLSVSEAKDFMEFWGPRLAAVSNDYVEFSFVGNSVMNKIAPLTITPAPDSLIRVFMYYRGVDTAGFSMPNYIAPVRKEFTAVEWGGILR